jgi:hypothetical protein
MPSSRYIRTVAGDTLVNRKDAGALGLAVLLPLGAYAYVNYAKFGSLFSVPFTRLASELADPARLQNLKLNGGTVFGLRFIPTTLLQYLRPDAINVRSFWPTFGPLARPLFGARFDGIIPSSSIPASMPAIALLSLVGILSLVRKSRRGSDGGPLKILVIATIVSTTATLSFGYIAERYLTDFLPVLFLTAFVGTNALIGRSRVSDPETKRVLWTGIGALVIVNLWVSAGLSRTSEQYRRGHDTVKVLNGGRSSEPSAQP